MLRRVSAEEIQQLYAFTRKHYVYYYDLQTELVDHLANGIEVQWQNNSQLSFEKALALEFKKFGVFGFSDVQEQRQTALLKKYHIIVWGHVKHFFKLPKIIATLGSMCVMYWLLLHFSYTFQLLVVTTIITMVVSYMVILKRARTEKATERKFMFKDVIFRYGIAGAIIVVPLQGIQLYNLLVKGNYFMVGPSWLAVLFSVFFVGYFLYTYITLVIIPKKANIYLEEVYPAYKLMQTM